MNRLFGIVLVVISAAAFGTLPIFGRFAYGDGLDVTTLLFLRFSFAAVILFAWMAFRKEALPRGRSLLQLVGMGSLGYVGQSFCYMSAIRYASVGLVSLLLFLYPVFVTILSVLFLKTKVTPRLLLALCLATLGAALTANPQGGQPLGIGLAISAAIIYSIYIIVGTGVMQKVSAIQSSAIIFASAGLVFGVITAFKGAAFPATSTGWLSVAAITFISTIVPVGTFLAGLKIIGPTDASLLSVMEPVVTIALGALLLDEPIKPFMLVGGVFILAAILLTINHTKKAA